MTEVIKTNPGEIGDWPMLQFVYRTDPDKLAALLPPGIEPGKEPNVNITIYNFPVPDQPEKGVLITVDANHNGIEGQYALGYGIDQESAIFISQWQNGQPKYPCEVEYYRVDNVVRARCIHQGYTFMEFEGKLPGEVVERDDEFTINEWWIKVSRAVGVMPTFEYDFPPHVVHVRSVYGTRRQETVKGELKLLPSPWDPIAEHLPIVEQLSANLWTPRMVDREITLAGKLDEEAFIPHLDVISGSRWPGTFGGPRMG